MDQSRSIRPDRRPTTRTCIHIIRCWRNIARRGNHRPRRLAVRTPVASSTHDARSPCGPRACARRGGRRLRWAAGVPRLALAPGEALGGSHARQEVYAHCAGRARAHRRPGLPMDPSSACRRGVPSATASPSRAGRRVRVWGHAPRRPAAPPAVPPCPCRLPLSRSRLSVRPRAPPMRVSCAAAPGTQRRAVARSSRSTRRRSA